MEWLRKVMPALFMTSRIGGDSHAIMTAWRFQEDHHSISLAIRWLCYQSLTQPFLFCRVLSTGVWFEVPRFF